MHFVLYYFGDRHISCPTINISLDEIEQSHDLSAACRSIICRNRGLSQIIHPLAADKSRYFAITEFNNCFIIRPPLPSQFSRGSFDQLKMSNQSLTARGTDLPFSHKSMLSITHEQNIICSRTLICRHLFAGHVVGSWPMKRRKRCIE